MYLKSSIYELSNHYDLALYSLRYLLPLGVREKKKPLLSSPAQLFDFPCQFSPELVELPHSFLGSQPFVSPMQKAFPLTAGFST